MPPFKDLHHFLNGTDYHFQGDDNRELMKVSFVSSPTTFEFEF